MPELLKLVTEAEIEPLLVRARLRTALMANTPLMEPLLLSWLVTPARLVLFSVIALKLPVVATEPVMARALASRT